MPVSTKHGVPSPAVRRKVWVGTVVLGVWAALVAVYNHYSPTGRDLPADLALVIGGTLELLVSYLSPPGEGEGVR